MDIEASVPEWRSEPHAWPKLANPMKLPVLLIVASILPFLSVTGPAFSGRSSALDTFAYPSDPYSDRSIRGAPYDPYGRGSAGFGRSDGMREPEDVPEWYLNPPRVDPQRARWPEAYADRVQGRGHGDYPSPYEGPPYRKDRPRRSDAATVWDDRYPGQSDLPREPSAVAEGYRFRGDDSADFGRWGAQPFGNGYQFRPLTEQEQQRQGPGARWRTREPAPSGERPRRPDPVPAREAYGYQSDSWFDRYYGEPR